MKPQWGVAFASVCVILSSGEVAMTAEPAKTEQLAGWFGVYPELAGYSRAFAKPVLTPEKKPEAYRQTAQYEWTGGAIKTLEVTLARDPAFKQKHSAESLRKEKMPPKEVKVGKRTGWLWQLEGGAKPDAVVARLVVPLGAEKALILEAKGAGPWEELTGLAERFDPARIEAALDSPPHTGSRRTIEAFKVLKKGVSYAEVVAWVGHADKDIGSGVHVMTYALPDGSRVLLGFADFKSLLYVTHETKDGKKEELVK